MWIHTLASVVLISTPVPAASGDEKAPEESVGDAIDRAAVLLVELQENYEGGDELREWPYEGVYRVRVKGKKGAHIPIGYRVGGTSICARALLEAPGPWKADGDRAQAVERGLDFVLEALDEELMSAGFKGGYDVRGWGQAYALGFLVRYRQLERVPADRAKAVDAAIESLVDALEETAIGERGGWNYSRRAGDRSDPSTFMTASCLQALFEARAAGEEVDEGVVAAALDAIEEARLDSGAFQYGTSPERMTGKGFEAIPGAIGRMPICESTLLLAGRGSEERVRSSIEAFFEHEEWLEKRRRQHGTHEPPYMIAPYYFFYAYAYAGQAIELLPEAEREPLRARLRELLFEVREDSGGWNDRVFERSENFGTAMALMALCAPELPRPAGWAAAD